MREQIMNAAARAWAWVKANKGKSAVGTISGLTILGILGAAAAGWITWDQAQQALAALGLGVQ